MQIIINAEKIGDTWHVQSTTHPNALVLDVAAALTITVESNKKSVNEFLMKNIDISEIRDLNNIESVIEKKMQNLKMSEI
jgi:hypothetical protein